MSDSKKVKMGMNVEDKIWFIIFILVFSVFGYIWYDGRVTEKITIEATEITNIVFLKIEEDIPVKIHGGVRIGSLSVIIPVTFEEFKDLIVEHSADVVYSTSKKPVKAKWINVNHFSRDYYVFNNDMTIGYVFKITIDVKDDMTWSWLDE